MGYYGDADVISISAKGTTETRFTGATYRATVSCSAATGPEAKEKALPIMAKVRDVIEKFEKSAGLDSSRVRTTFDVDVETHRSTGEFLGHKAVWTCRFTGTEVREAPVVHGALTSIDGVRAPTPTYSVDDSAEVHAVAFRDAVTKAQKLFEAHCAALGFQPSEFYVKSWTTQDDDRGGGKTLSYATTATDAIKAVGLEPGKASLDVNVTLAYARKSARA